MRFKCVAGMLALILSGAAAPAIAAPTTPGFEYAVTEIEPTGRAAEPRAFRVAGTVVQECTLWNRACAKSCNAKYSQGLPGDAGLEWRRVRASLVANCHSSCMEKHNVCN